VRLTICGLVTAESVNVRVPVAGPVAVGEKVTPTVQLAPAPIVAPQVLLATANPVLALTVAIERALLKWLVNVTVRTALVVPTFTVEKLMELAEKVTGALLVPDRLTV
jgi:hypothetical protein